MQMTMTFRTFNIGGIEDMLTAVSHGFFRILFITAVGEVDNKLFATIGVRTFY